MRTKVEISLSGVESAIAAQLGGADRVELCENLLEGGTTPSLGMIAIVRKYLNIEMNVIIRPRGGDCCYSEAEMEVMKRDIETAGGAGVDGVVIGLLNPDGTVDEERTRALVDLARPMSTTFHRAFDHTRDPIEALDTLIGLGIDRVLTSGQAATAFEGLVLVTELNQHAQDRIVIMAGAGINALNARHIVETCGVHEIHVGSAATEDVKSLMQYHNPKIAFRGGTNLPEDMLRRTSADRVKAIVEALG
ncbi:MAG: copper homeostasis protein CutC [Anaerolineaceae bacterium]|nr:MAG: copper homeostasis protein CutC [Anaerolineaceae bacterium]